MAGAGSDNLFITDMPVGLDQSTVTEIFSMYGTVCSVRITSKPENQFTSALVRFATPEDASYILENVNGNIPHSLSTPVTIRYANNSGAPKPAGVAAAPRATPYSMNGQGMATPNMAAAAAPKAWGNADQSGGGDNLFVTDMPVGLDQNTVQDIFGKYGTIISLRITSKPENQFTSALIKFATPQEAAYVLENLNGRIPESLEAPVTIRYANSSSKGSGRGAQAPAVNGMQAFTPQFAGGAGASGWESVVMGIESSGILPGANQKESLIEVFVFGLDGDCTNYHLYRMFSSFGQIAPNGCRIVTEKGQAKCRGFGFVNFLTMESAQMAINALHGHDLPNGNKLRVEIKKAK